MECFKEFEADFAVLTETWLKDSVVEPLVEELSRGSGLGILTRNREAVANGVAYGGVAVVWREAMGRTAEIKYKNKEGYEIMVTASSIKGQTRKLVIIACYLPPGYSKVRGAGALAYVEDLIVDLKSRYKDPFVVVAGDFNQWKIEGALDNFVDIKEVDVGVTRGRRSIDRIFTNFSRSIMGCGTLEPLETEEDGGQTVKSDHKIAYFRAGLEKKRSFTWEKYTYRRFDEGSVERFKDWVVMYDWQCVLGASTSDGKAEAYQEAVVNAMETFFPLRTVRRKSTDPPWMDGKTKKALEDKKKLFIEEGGRTDFWKAEKKKVDLAVKARKREFFDMQKEHLLQEDAGRHFYRNVRSFGCAEKPKLFDVRDLMPEGQSDADIADTLAEYFKKVSCEFEPLGPDQIACTRDKELPVLHEYEVASRIRRFRKPRSTVPGDIFPKLVTQFADFLAIPLADIYNCITSTRRWPVCWKREFVTIIPKKTNPVDLSELRNISCTLLASKMYESYLLDWVKEEVKLRGNQYGGMKGLSTDHLLVGLWQKVLENAEDYRAATVITSIDYSKAFNRMSYQECLTALARNGASSPVLELIATFLTDRVMMVKVGSTLSRPRPVNGGCPQGSILGVFLFNATIDDLEEECEDLPDTRRSLRRKSEAVPSTPRGNRAPFPSQESPIIRPKKAAKRLNYSNELGTPVPYEGNHWTEAKWKAALALFLRYIDDGFCLSKVNFENSFGFEVNGQNIRVKHAVQAQNIFRHIVRNAESIGMVVNSKKTAMMCVSGALNFEADAFILDSEQTRIGCTRSIKALGVRFSNKLDMEEHVKYIAKAMRARYWTLRNLKGNGFNSEELVQVYKTMIRPLAEYGCPAYHSSLTDEQDERLERLQDHALKCIFGPEKSARKLRGLAGITTLRQRREDLVLKFATKCANDPAFEHWFPKRITGRATRNQNAEVFLEEKARCDRLKNSPLYYFRRILNGKTGKLYGTRNKSYREEVVHEEE